jgi:hypothetical protein
MAGKFKQTGAERAALLRDPRVVYKSGDEREFMRILRKHGIKDEHPHFSEMLKFFRDLRAGKT